MKKNLTLLIVYLLILLPYTYTIFAQSPCDLSGGQQAAVINIDTDEIIVQTSSNDNGLQIDGSEVQKRKAAVILTEDDCLKSLTEALAVVVVKQVPIINAEVWQLN